MKRYTLVDYESANADVRAIYDDFLRQTGSTAVPYWVQSLGCNVPLLHAYWERTKGSLVHGVMPSILKEMVIFVVSVENGSRYCSACHAHAVLGMDPTLKFEDLNALLDTEDQRLKLPPSHRAALNFAIRMARDANAVSDADFESLRDADFDDDEIRELLSVIDLATMFNKYTSAMRLPLDPEYKPVLAPVAA
ncbi:MAG: carboxymuconolactone decarboxylase family protein [Burkholderiales bacterium]|nr:carboxymuconolactone decarboxylase family protein [Burkholderiales bacterium]